MGTPVHVQATRTWPTWPPCWRTLWRCRPATGRPTPSAPTWRCWRATGQRRPRLLDTHSGMVGNRCNRRDRSRPFCVPVCGAVLVCVFVCIVVVPPRRRTHHMSHHTHSSLGLRDRLHPRYGIEPPVPVPAITAPVVPISNSLARTLFCNLFWAKLELGDWCGVAVPPTQSVVCCVVFVWFFLSPIQLPGC